MKLKDIFNLIFKLSTVYSFVSFGPGVDRLIDKYQSADEIEIEYFKHYTPDVILCLIVSTFCLHGEERIIHTTWRSHHGFPRQVNICSN